MISADPRSRAHTRTSGPRDRRVRSLRLRTAVRRVAISQTGRRRRSSFHRTSGAAETRLPSAGLWSPRPPIPPRDDPVESREIEIVLYCIESIQYTSFIATYRAGVDDHAETTNENDETGRGGCGAVSFQFRVFHFRDAAPLYMTK